MDNAQTRLAELYTAVLGRAPDAAGLAYWSQELAIGNMSLESIASNWMTSQQEVLQRYPATMDTASFITAIYSNVLGRVPDDAGLGYWQGELQSGGVPRDAFIAAIINGAKSNGSAQGQQDAALLANKAAVGIAFAEQGLNSASLAELVLGQVSADPLSARATTALIRIAQDDQDDLHIGLGGLAQLGGAPSALAVDYLQSIASEVVSADRDLLFPIIRDELQASLSNSAAFSNPYQQALAALTRAGEHGNQPLVLTGTANRVDHFTVDKGVHSVEIKQFELDLDRLSLTDAVGRPVDYRGEADTREALILKEFNGTPGQAGFARSSNELLVDINGDNLIDEQDLVITLQGVYQLEDYHFV